MTIDLDMLSFTSDYAHETKFYRAVIRAGQLVAPNALRIDHKQFIRLGERYLPHPRIGLGDLIAQLAGRLGIHPSPKCHCARRRRFLNRLPLNCAPLARLLQSHRSPRL